LAILSYVERGHYGRHQVAVFIHGIMGNKKNWLIFINNWLASFPGWTALVFDLPNHGDSPKHMSPYTVGSCAQELVSSLKQLGIEPQVVIGHSFGAKVALLTADQLTSVEQIWLLDSSPGAVVAKPLDHQELSALELIDLLASLAWPQPSRKALVAALLNYGVSNNIALWMTTNLSDSPSGLILTFIPAELKAMLIDFFKLDLWPLITKLAPHKKIHLVAAEYGQRLNQADQDMLADKTDKRGFFHTLKHAGHFLHADKPADLIKLMADHW